MTIKRFSLVIIVLAMVLAGCPDPNGSNGNGNGNNGNGKQPIKFNAGYLSNLMVDIGDASALGIVKRSVQQPVSRNARAVTGVEEIVEKNYLVKITTDVYHGNVEWDENGLTNVTFSKRTTKTVTIPVYDEEGNLIGEEPIEDGQTVTQDEIPAQVNRLYVHYNYTFLQFVPEDTAGVTDVRPADLGIADTDGYYAFDKRDYYNDDLHQSFVIENITGNIYSLGDDVYIAEIHNGLIQLRYNPQYIYDLRINQNDELEIFNLNVRTDFEIYDWYKDKYGNNYIWNSLIEDIDYNQNVIYFKGASYHVATNGEVLFTKGVTFSLAPTYGRPNENKSYFFGKSLRNAGFEFNEILYEIKIVGPNCQYRSVTAQDELYFSAYDGDDLNPAFSFGFFISHIKNKELYLFRRYTAQPSNYFYIFDTDNPTIPKKAFYVSLDNAPLIDIGSQFPVRYDTVLFYDKSGKQLFYLKINDYATLDINIYGAASIDALVNPPVLLVPNCEKEIINSYYNYDGWYLIWNTATSRERYSIVYENNGGSMNPKAIKTSDYLAGEQNIVRLKPINR